MHVRTPGGGGYGNPYERSPKLVLEDVVLERYTVDEARALFGVAIGGPPFWVMEAETKCLREIEYGHTGQLK